MVGGGSRRDDGYGLPAINSTNIFSALESRRRKSSKKRSDKDNADSTAKEVQQPPAATTWAPAPVTVTSWADCEDDDDEEFAMLALPPLADQQQTESVDGASNADAHEGLSEEEESEEEEEEVEGEPDDDGNEEREATKSDPTPAVDTKPVPTVTREPERQLSKKELRKKGLAELEEALAELGLNQKDESDASNGLKNEMDGTGEANGHVEKTGSGPVVEIKTPKRRKPKKEKSFKEGKTEEDTDAVKDGTTQAEVETNSMPADPKEVLKRIASMKKKKSFKDSDGAAKAAAAEAAARAAKLAAAKKKEKSHYNQQPVR